MDEPRIRFLRPAAWSRIEFVRKDAHGDRNGDAFRTEMSEFAPALSVEPRARKRRVRQPGILMLSRTSSRVRPSDSSLKTREISSQLRAP